MPRWLPRMFVRGALTCLLSVPAAAQEADSATRDAARTLGLSGVDAYQAGDYEVASARLEKAYALINVPSLGLWSARALVKRNLLVEAANRYFEVVGLQVPQGDAAVQRQAQTDAQTELEQLRPRIPRLLIRVSGADPAELTLSIDGQATPASIIGKPRLVNPGPHRVEAKVGALQKAATVELVPAQEAAVDLDFARAAPKPRPVTASPPALVASSGSPRRTWGWIGVGVGGAGLALGGVMGALALDKHASIENSGACSDGRCPADKQSDVTRLNTFRVASSVGLIAGGVLAGTGIVLLLTAPSSERELAATLSGERVMLTGRF
jgi:hypothetical protein